MEKYLQQSSSLFGSLKSAVLGNTVTREFTVERQTGSFGPGLSWKIFDGKKKSTGQDVSVFVFEKKQLERLGKGERDVVIERMRKGPVQLTKLRHPRLLTVQHPLEESRDTLAFATEPVFASLANVLGSLENVCPSAVEVLKNHELYDVEKSYGLFQVSEGLAFLHNDVKLTEGNLTPENIVVTREGHWKLSGFFYASSAMDSSNVVPWNSRIPLLAKPDLNYASPEYILEDRNESASDMYSFGCLVCAVYSHMKTPYDAGNNVTSYKRCIEQLSRFGSDHLNRIPFGIRDHVLMLLNVAAGVRPDADSTSKHPFFNDVASMTLKYLDSLVQRDDITKSNFFKSLHQVLSKLPKRVLHQRVLPQLFLEFPNHAMLPFALPNVLLIAEDCSVEEFSTVILPELKKVFVVQEPVQVLLIFMQKMELLLRLTPPEDVRSSVLPMVFRALECQSTQIQELVLSVIPNFAHLIDYSTMKNAILPRIKTLITKTRSLPVRVNSLVCIGKIIDQLDKFLMIDHVFPALTQVPSREPAVLMAILGIYKKTINHKKIHLEKDYLATKVVPFLLPLAVDPGLNASQFNNFMAVIREIIDNIEQEHRTKLEQLDKMKEQQRSALDFAKEVDESKKLDSMGIGDESSLNGRQSSLSYETQNVDVFGLDVSSAPKPSNKTSYSTQRHTSSGNPSSASALTLATSSSDQAPTRGGLAADRYGASQGNLTRASPMGFSDNVIQPTRGTVPAGNLPSWSSSVHQTHQTKPPTSMEARGLTSLASNPTVGSSSLDFLLATDMTSQPQRQGLPMSAMASMNINTQGNPITTNMQQQQQFHQPIQHQQMQQPLMPAQGQQMSWNSSETTSQFSSHSSMQMQQQHHSGVMSPLIPMQASTAPVQQGFSSNLIRTSESSMTNNDLLL